MPATGLYRLQMNASISNNINPESTKTYKNGSGLLGAGSCNFNATLGFGNGASGVLSFTASDTIKVQNAFATVNYCAGSDAAYTWHAIEPLAASTKYALVYPSASISITTGAWRTLGYDSEVADTDSIHPLAATVTMTIASPCVVTWTGHNFLADSPIVFTNSGGALPTGITAGTTYFVKSPSGSTFNVAATPGGAAINTTGSQSGTHTGTNYSRLTVPSGFTARGRLSWGVVTSNTNTQFGVLCAKNGTTNFTGCPLQSKGASGNKAFSRMGPPIAVTAGDYFEHQVFPGASASIINDPYTFFCLESVPASIQACLAKKTSNQTITTTYSDVTFDSEEYDDNSIHSTSSNTERFTVPTGCTRARFHFGSYASATTGTPSVRLKVNNAYPNGATASESDVSGYGIMGASSPWVSVTPGDYFSAEMKTTSGTCTIGTNTWACLECE